MRFLCERRSVHLFRMRPGIDVPGSDHNGNKKQKHQRNRSGRGLEHSPDNQAPMSTSQVLQHQQRQTSQCDPRPEEIRDKVGMKELFPIDENSNDENKQRDATNNQSYSPDLANFRWDY